MPCYGALVDVAPAQSRLDTGKFLQARCQSSMILLISSSYVGVCLSVLQDAPMQLLMQWYSDFDPPTWRTEFLDQETNLSSIPSWDSRAQRERQKPSLGYTADRRSTTWARALLAFHVNRRIRYAIVSAADRLTPAPQWMSVAAYTHTSDQPSWQSVT